MFSMIHQPNPLGPANPLSIRQLTGGKQSKTRKLQLLFEQWVSASEKWSSSSLVISMKQRHQRRHKGGRRWLTKAQIAIKYNSKELAEEICHHKESDEYLRSTETKPFPDKPGLLLYLVWDEEYVSEERDEVLEQLYELRDDSEPRQSKKDKKNESGKSKRKRSSSSRSSGDSGSCNDDSSSSSQSSSSSKSSGKTKKTKKTSKSSKSKNVKKDKKEKKSSKSKNGKNNKGDSDDDKKKKKLTPAQLEKKLKSDKEKAAKAKDREEKQQQEKEKQEQRNEAKKAGSSDVNCSWTCECLFCISTKACETCHRRS